MAALDWSRGREAVPHVTRSEKLQTQADQVPSLHGRSILKWRTGGKSHVFCVGLCVCWVVRLRASKKLPPNLGLW